ncbi:DNA-binding transcriptional response regulator, NtrC family, contains REC, AAA-type ATPase, and a Fis-type DNA-binding domains [Flavobacterium gillisiae]|uniref:DNA-binding transcriptional response regulator, NtrC family, contains REC, AAA-type ATPase, and a Fis-type DNA-binding domains n=1 Tax=Flavobacterium gillisiae TaxID=150146 RepID=A0A1H4DVU5_9FLAO|nr:sigma-54 dependent transcriptional regulator [Flavobacterium gillisiae]SEA76312.1 DNA-binding transcriptional response regulator, NtrC family, contains REC, AAA-type ATPase, and a Fis-type DNA-binding domains [Flavobacterium gillisiae]
MKLKKENILIVDDNYDMLELLHRNLKAQNFHTYKASSVMEAIEILKFSTIDLLITDLQMPGINGIELIKYVQEHFPTIPKLVITGFPSVDSAIEAVKSGALDYLAKPFTNDELKKAVQALIDSKEDTKTSTNETSISSTDYITEYAGIVGQSQQIVQLVDLIQRVKDNRATVLIQGESGTGKELVARAIHYEGAFSSKPFIAVNCGAIPENLMESELFGYVKGAFTGANDTRDGFFQAAAGGTIFLDEIGTAPLAVQTRLLRVLQEKEVSMIGSQKTQKIELRIIAATNNDLYEMSSKGSFREDLYYRLNVVNIETPPLRNRKSDIRLLITTFLNKYGGEYNKSKITISEKAILVLMRHSWPGNVRELENVIQRMIIMSGNQIEVGDVPEYLKYPMPFEKEELRTLKDIEKAHILKVLAAVDNNKTRAAEILQIDRKTLRQKIE